MMLSGQIDSTAIQRARDEADMFEMISKPWDAKELIRYIDQGLAQFKRTVSGKKI